MIVYLESSAALAWLIGEASQQAVVLELQRSERVVTSALTAVECARALVRARALRRITATEEIVARHLLAEAESSWDVHDLSEEILARAREGFPTEPVRSLDALHLATIDRFREVLGTLSVISLDERVRANSRAAGLEVLPIEA